MKYEPLSKTIINCAKEGIMLKVTLPNGAIIEPTLTDEKFAALMADHDTREINKIANQIRRIKFKNEGA